MKVLLTGISGNLGYEVAVELNNRGIDIIPLVRPGKKDILRTSQIKFSHIIESELTNAKDFEIPETVDCIVHCAGNIHFRDSGNINQAMMKTIIKIAKESKIPIYFVSTAFVYRPPGIKVIFNNNYESDKFQAEQELISSGVPHTIFRPSVIVGNSKTGQIQNFSGYYSIVKAFLEAADSINRRGRKLRFPNLPGKSDLITVDQVACCMGDVIENKKLEELFYITNPNPPKASWVLEETLNFFKISNKVNILDINFENYGELDLSNEERILYKFCINFNPYWTINYNFPATICSENLINHEYLSKTLSYFSSVNEI